jgi:hypothetical protein
LAQQRYLEFIAGLENSEQQKEQQTALSRNSKVTQGLLDWILGTTSVQKSASF